MSGEGRRRRAGGVGTAGERRAGLGWLRISEKVLLELKSPKADISRIQHFGLKQTQRGRPPDSSLKSRCGSVTSLSETTLGWAATASRGADRCQSTSRLPALTYFHCPGPHPLALQY